MSSVRSLRALGVLSSLVAWTASAQSCAGFDSSIAAPIPAAFQTQGAFTWDGPFNTTGPGFVIVGRTSLTMTSTNYRMSPYSVVLNGIPIDNSVAPTDWQCVNNTPGAVAISGDVKTVNLTTTDPGTPPTTRPGWQCVTFTLFTNTSVVGNTTVNTTLLRSGQTGDFKCVPYVPLTSQAGITVLVYHPVPATGGGGRSSGGGVGLTAALLVCAAVVLAAAAWRLE